MNLTGRPIRRHARLPQTHETLNRVLDNAAKAAPDIGVVCALLNTWAEEEVKLRATYAEAARYKVRDERIDTILNQNRRAATSQAADKAASQRTIPSPSDGNVGLPQKITYDGILKARSKIESFAERARPRVLRLLKQPGGKEVALELPAGPIDRLAEVVSPLAEEYPMLKPIVDILKSTLTDAVELAFKRKLENLTSLAAEHPESIETTLPNTSQEIANSAPTKIEPEAARQLSRNASILRRDTRDIRSNADRLQQELSAAKEQELSAARAKEQRAERAARAREVAEAREREVSPPPRRRAESTRPHSLPDTTEFQPPSEPSGGGFGGASSGGRMVVTGCTCNHYVNGALMYSTKIPVGGRCGTQVCQ
jgi:hypothetical protein